LDTANDPDQTEPASDEREKNVLQLRGLPPQEAMLARKTFRAISVDLTNAPSDLSGNISSDVLANTFAQQLESTLEEVVSAPPGFVPSIHSEASSDPALPIQPTQLSEKSLLASRSMKQAANPQLVVSKAIMRLSTLGALSDESESP
jgi:hypothetical protein